MAKDPSDGFRLATLAVRAGQVRTPEGEHSEPIFLTSSFVFKSAAQAAARFSGDEPGNIYSRFTNPTVRTFQDRLAALEGGETCVATASGMAAIAATCLALLKSGDHLVASRGVFGTTTSLFTNYLPRYGIEVDFVSLPDLEAWEAVIRPNTKLLFLETPSNPLGELVDIEALAKIAKRKNVLLAVDNCYCTPALQKPFEWGADLVIHTATKYLDGQGRALGGAVVGDKELVGKEIFGFLRTAGPAMSPFNAWLFTKGLETLNLRMRAHCDNALAIAQWLEAQPQVERVHYPGLESHPHHALARRQQTGFGGLVSFEVKGGRPEAWAVVDATRLISITANLGDVKTTITHPATTTHSRLSDEQRAAAGIRQSLLRVSVGLEDVDDLKADLKRGLDRLG